MPDTCGSWKEDVGSPEARVTGSYELWVVGIQLGS